MEDHRVGDGMAMSSIHSHTPAAVMELPISATTDSKQAMLFRELCDERITLPAELFRDTPIHERIEKLYGGGIIEARRYWRCNTEHFWTDPHLARSRATPTTRPRRGDYRGGWRRSCSGYSTTPSPGWIGASSLWMTSYGYYAEMRPHYRPQRSCCSS